MPIAVDKEGGNVVYLDDQGQWSPAQTAMHPQTKKTVAFDGKDWVDVIPPSRTAGQLAGDVGMSMANGATFGFAGEGMAAGQTALGMGKPTYGENLADWQAREKEIPLGIKIPGEVAGGALATMAAAPVAGPAAAATGIAKIPAWLRYAGMGTLGGAAYGAGDAEPGQRLEGAGKGAAIGLAAGPAVASLGKTGREVYGAFAPQSNVTADLSRALTRDKDTPQALLQRFQDAQSIRPGVANALDVAGPNLSGLGERVANTPGAGLSVMAPALTGRQQGQLGRISSDLRGLTGTTQSATQAISDTMAQRAKAAGPLYDAAMNFNARNSPEIVNEFQRATSTGWGKSILNSQELKNNLQTEYGIKDVADAPLMVLIDAFKKQADAVVGQAIKKENGNMARIVGDMRDNLVKTVDQYNPAYAKARDAWSGDARYIDAINEGKSIFSTKVDAESLTAGLGAMGAADQEAYRIGAVGAIIGKMGNDPSKMGDMTKYLRSPEMRAKVAALMPDQAARDAWTQRLNFEITSSEVVGKSLGNSATARRLAQRDDADSIVGDLVMDAFAGSPPVSLVKRMIGLVPTNIRDTLRSKSDHILAELLTDPQSMQGLVRAMDRVSQRGTPPSVLRTNTAITGTNAGVAAAID